MGKYTVFLDVSKAIVDMLKDKLIPEPLEKAENIGICSPNDRGSFTVGLHLYDYSENTNFGRQQPVRLPNGYTRRPPTSYKLSYLISVASKAEVLIRTAEETRILGKILQSINDNSVLEKKYIPESLKAANEKLELRVVSMELEDKIKIWSMFNEAYKQSIFFEVSPVMLESAIVTPPSTRVETINIGEEQK